MACEIAGVLDFPDIRQLLADEFCEAVLSQALRARRVVVGADFRFGRDRGGDAELADQRREAPRVRGLRGRHVRRPRRGRFVDEDPPTASATGWSRKRRLCLGRPYELAGEVIEGDKRGRTIGFPTANIGIPPDRQLPGRGVYAGAATVEGEVFAAAINVGTRPTFDGRGITIEAICSTTRVTSTAGSWPLTSGSDCEKRCGLTGVEDLIRQIRPDVERVREVLN